MPYKLFGFKLPKTSPVSRPKSQNAPREPFLRTWKFVSPRKGMPTCTVKASTKSEARAKAKSEFVDSGHLKRGERLPIGTLITEI